jgi:hypothetical protein
LLLAGAVTGATIAFTPLCSFTTNKLQQQSAYVCNLGNKWQALVHVKTEKIWGYRRD